MNKKELMKLTKAELLELAKTNGRYVEESMSKAQIVEIMVGSDESADQQPAEQSEGQQPADQSANEQAEEQHSADEHSDETPSEENPSEQNPADEHADESAPEENPADESAPEENPSDDQGDNTPGENPASETPSDEKPSDERPAEQSVLRKKIAIAEELRRRQSRVGSGITKFAGSIQQVMKQEIANRALKFGGVKSKILSSKDRKEVLRKERDLRASRNK